MDPFTNPSEFFTLLTTAISGGTYTVIGALAIMALVAIVRRWGSAIYPALGSGKSAVLTSLVLGLLVGLGSGLLEGKTSAAALLASAVGGLGTALAGSGLYSATKKLREE